MRCDVQSVCSYQDGRSYCAQSCDSAFLVGKIYTNHMKGEGK